jgi:dUTP pyrophosphatase
MAISINFIKLQNNAVQPSQGSSWAAGHDLYSCGRYFIEPHTTLKIGTGIAMEIPEGYFGAVFARSGLATKHGLRPANCVGVIDADYRGELIVALHNDTDMVQEVSEGERIAQIVICPYLPVDFTEVRELSSTERGAGGFGSTGTH